MGWYEAGRTWLQSLRSYFPLFWPEPHGALSAVPLPDQSVIYLSNAQVAGDEARLDQHGIRRIISIRTPWVGFSPLYAEIDALAQRRPDLQVIVVHFWDHPTTSLAPYWSRLPHWLDCHDRIPTLLHCTMGRSRSAALAVAFLVLQYHQSFHEAQALVQAARPEIRINPGFCQQLEALAAEGAQEGWNRTVFI